LRRTTLVYLTSAALFGCGGASHTVAPAHPLPPATALDESDSSAFLARSLAPVLYLQRDEPFSLEHVVAVVHPIRKIIAYHLSWRDDAHGAWLPFQKPTDHEIIWVGYDSTSAPTDVWTYWHRTILHADWKGQGPVLADVQWGKHGSMPTATRPADLPWDKSNETFYLLTWILPDLWLGSLVREGPRCFCHSYRRYLTFSTPLPLGPRIDLIVRSEDPLPALRAVVGSGFSKKVAWP
jgi:hypothetical protein